MCIYNSTSIFFLQLMTMLAILYTNCYGMSKQNSESLHQIPFQLINYGLTVVKMSVLGSIWQKLWLLW